MVEKGPLTTMKLGSTDMSTSHWCAIVALWFAPGTREVHGRWGSTECTVYIGILLVSKSRILVSRFYPGDTRLRLYPEDVHADGTQYRVS